jgi:hypothetical protein
VLRLLAPLIERLASFIVKYEIWADSRIARFAPEAADSDGRQWQLTSWDKQIFVNRKLMETVYLAGAGEAEADSAPRAAADG